MRKRRLRGVLVLYADYGTPYAGTMREHIHSFRRYSRYPVYEVNTTLDFPATLPRFDFAAIVLHYSLFGIVPYAIGEPYLSFLEAAGDCYRIAFFQDDYRFCRERFDFIDRYRIDCAYTLIEPRWHAETFFARSSVRKVVHTLPGYVSPELLEAAAHWGRPDAEREIDVGYRGRDVPYYLGVAGREKTVIAQEFIRRAQESDLRLDVSADGDDRIYGDGWYAFLGNCKSVLGVEGGASLVDLDGEVQAIYDRLLAEKPDLTWEEFSRLAQPELARWDYRITDLTASPRIFEAAAFRCAQVLFTGRYADLIEPGDHYFALEKDFGNFDDVVEQLRDPALRRSVADAAYEHLISSGEYTYEGFVGGVDRLLEEEGVLPGEALQEPDAKELRLVQRPRRRVTLRRIAGALKRRVVERVQAGAVGFGRTP
jgi:hypothetical protein